MKNRKKVLIVGGVAGGASVATRLRRLSEDYEIIIFERGEHISFANCGLPYHIGKVIPERESLIIQTPQKFKERFNIDVRNFSEVTGVDTDNNSISVTTKAGENYSESYDFLVLAPGAKSFVPNIFGINSKKIQTLRNIPDMDKIIENIKNENTQSVAVIGGGFIGIETAENIKSLNLETHLIESNQHILAPFDNEFSQELEKEMMEKGIKIHLLKKVVKFEERKDEVDIYFEGGSKITVNFVVLAIGNRADTNFLKESSISLNKRGEILVDEYLRTNIDNVYALGDAIPGFALAGPANRQGRIVANNIFGKNEKYKVSIGTSIIKVFDITAASTGKNENTLKREKVDYSVSIFYPNSHANYYPNATQLHCKVIFEKNTAKILGAQAIGYENVDKFIDVVASVIHFKGSIYDLSELELCYAPPFGSAKSPINMGGFIGRNIFENLVEIISYREELEKFNSEENFLLDLRTEEEIKVAPVKNSINIPVDELRENLNKIPKDKEIWTLCAVGLRGYIGSRILKQAGYKVKNIAGGYRNIPETFKILNGDLSSEDFNSTNQKNSDIKSKSFEELNLTGISCPGPIMRLKAKMDSSPDGHLLKVTASDPAFANDVKAWANTNGSTIHEITKSKGFVNVLIEKNSSALSNKLESCVKIKEDKESMTLIFFSGDYDKAIAAFILANGAVAMGKKVTMFFTFWGLSMLKKENSPKTKKSFLDTMFSICLPSSWKKMPLSKMNFGGAGRGMLNFTMKKKNLISLSELLKEAKDNKINMIACSMSMDAMVISKEELIDGIDFGGVGQYLGEAEKSSTNLFI